MHVAIAGAGLMGRLLAFELVNAGWQVSLFDQDSKAAAASCSMAAAGLLAPYAELEKTDLSVFKMGCRALQEYWPATLARLNQDIYFRHSGGLVVAHPQDQCELQHLLNVIKNKLAIDNFYQKLDKHSLLKIEPELHKIQHGVFLPQEGQIDNQAVMHSLENYLSQHTAVTWYERTTVQALQPGKIILEDGSKNYDWVIDSRGLGGKSSFAELRGVRGELIWLHAPEVTLTHPVRLLHPRYHLYIVPRPEHIYLVGASEMETEDMSNISVRSVLELLSAVYYLHPGFSEARILKTVAHCRPTLPHHLPQIKYQVGMLAVNGLYRHGCLLAPALAKEVLQFLKEFPSHSLVKESQL